MVCQGLRVCESLGGGRTWLVLLRAGNDQVDWRYFTILVRFWKEEKHIAVTRFLDMPVKKPFAHISKKGSFLARENVVGFASDSANMMVGSHNSVLSCVPVKQPWC